MIGATYSNTDYDNYKMTGDTNYFEEIIDKMILDGISGMNDTFKNAIRNLSKDKKSYSSRQSLTNLLLNSQQKLDEEKKNLKNEINKHIKEKSNFEIT